MTETIQTFLLDTVVFIIGVMILAYVVVAAMETYIHRKTKDGGLYHGITRRITLKRLGGE